jgi:hypothetical protein
MLLMPLGALPDIEKLGTFDHYVIIDECLSESLAKYRPFVVVTVYGERLLAFWQQPPTDPAFPEIRNPSCGTVNSDLAEFHQHLGIERSWIRIKG